MEKLVKYQSKIVPELMEKLLHRLEVLQRIEVLQPVGRRTLADHVGLTERILRAEVELLKEAGLVEIYSSGMYITEEGRELLEELLPLVHQFRGIGALEEALATRLGLNKVYIVPGDSAVDPLVKNNIGRIAAQHLKKNSKKGDQIAVTGGTSLAAMAEMMVTDHPYPFVTLYPARGGLGERVDIQANTITAKLAEKMGADYRLLHVPDDIREETYRSLIEEPQVRERVNEIRHVRMVYHGIGNALAMAKRRGANPDVIELLQERKAVSEAFGYYFNGQGEIVYKMPTMGLHIEDLENKEAIAIAGGSDKATAIDSLAKTGIFKVLITDEGAASKILGQD